MSDLQGGTGGWDAPGSAPEGGYGTPQPAPYPAAYPAPYGAPAAYGSQPGYGAPALDPYGRPVGYYPPMAGPRPLPEGVSYASWGSRALALIIDTVLMFVCVMPGVTFAIVAATMADESDEDLPVWQIITLVALILGGFVLWFYNHLWVQGKRGQSWGKQVVGIHLVAEHDLRPPGGGMGVARYAVRSALGNATCGVYSLLTVLWPLWDGKNQSLDDKLLHTLVVRLPRQ